MEGLRTNQSQKTDLSPDLSLESGSTVVQIIHVGNVQLTGNIARHVAKGTILPKNAGLIKGQGTGSAKKSFKYREVNVDQKSSDDGQNRRDNLQG